MNWECLCTAQNELRNSNCPLCGSTRCDVCTLVNLPNSHSCNACGNTLKVAQPPPQVNAPLPPPPLPVIKLPPPPVVVQAIPVDEWQRRISAPSAPPKSPHELSVRRIIHDVQHVQEMARTAGSVFVDFLSRDEMSMYDWRSVLMDLRPPHPMQHQPWVVFDPVRGVQADDIAQGELGDCWFLSSLAVLAYARPELVRDLFIVDTVNPEGVFAVKLCEDGVWKAFIIDATFPTVHQGKALKHARAAQGNVLWVSLLEKAYAKMQGGYQKLTSGCSIDAFYDLTGLPCSELRNKAEHSTHTGAINEYAGDWNEGETFQQLMSYHSAGCCLGASCGGGSRTQHADRRRLISHHCYSVLDLAVCSTTHRPMILLRNPWRKTDFRGEQPPQQHVLRREDPGSFWMNFSAFTECFSEVTVCRTRKYVREYCTSSVVARPEMSYAPPFDFLCSDLAFAVDHSTEVHFLITQRDIRHSHHMYHDVFLLIVQVTDTLQTPYHFVAMSKPSSSRLHSYSVILHEGTYLVIPISFQCSSPMVATIFSESAAVSQIRFPRGVLQEVPLNSLLFAAVSR